MFYQCVGEYFFKHIRHLNTHWLCVTDFVVYSGTVSQAYKTEISTALIKE